MSGSVTLEAGNEKVHRGVTSCIDHIISPANENRKKILPVLKVIFDWFIIEV